MSTHIQKAEQLGSECAIELLDRLLACNSQAEAVPQISGFLQALGNECGREFRNAACDGAATALVDVLLTGINAIRQRSAQ